MAAQNVKATDVLINHPVRVTVAFVVLGLYVSIFAHQADSSLWLWVYVIGRTLIYPHIIYYFSQCSAHEKRNLLADIALFGVDVAIMGFNPFIMAIFAASSCMVCMARGGWVFLALGAVSHGVGLMVGAWLHGFYFRSSLSGATLVIASLGLLVFMGVLGHFLFMVNQSLRQTRNRLISHSVHLASVNNLAATVNANLDLDVIVTALMDALKSHNFECLYVMPFDEKSQSLTIGEVYGEDLKEDERIRIKNLTLNVEKDKDSIFIRTLRQERFIQVSNLTPEKAALGAACDQELYAIKPSVSIANFPVFVNEKVVAVLSFINFKSNFYLDELDLENISAHMVQVGTAIKNLEMFEQLKKSKEVAEVAQLVAESSEEAKTRFLASMSHEIRTPLTAILGYSDALREDQLNDKERTEFLQIIQNSGKHLLSMINDILDISKIEANKVRLEIMPVNLVDIIHQIRSYLDIHVKNVELDYQLKFTYPLPKVILTDPTRLQQILFNLCSNAIKFTNEGFIVLELAWPGQQELVFKVRDTGVGLKQEEQERIFGSYSQAGTSTTRLFGGTGLGLFISRNLAQLMSGDIEVESKKGEGSCFTLTTSVGELGEELVLLNSDEEMESALAESLVVLGAQEQLPQFKGRVLVAEDDQDNLGVVSRFLEQLGLQVRLANNGAEVMRALSHETFDLILLDMQMPVMGGEETAREIIKEGHKTPLIAFTASVMTFQVERYYKAGFQAVIEKPIDRKRFVNTLETYLSKKEFKPCRVLIVDDDKVNGMILSRYVQSVRHDIEVDMAHNGCKAIEKADASKYDLILMDMEMPIMGGLEATQTMRDQGFQKPIYIVTGNVDQDYVGECLQAGADGHLSKPIDKDQLGAVLQQYCFLSHKVANDEEQSKAS